MKKTLLFAVLSAVCSICSAYDFSAVSSSGHTLYYNIKDNGVWVTSQNVEGSAPVIAYDAKIDGLYYKFSEDEAIVTYEQYWQTREDGELIEHFVSHYIGDIVIPETVEHNGKTYRVTAIGDHAFFGCSEVTSITIPESVDSIGSEAFFRCNSLNSVVIPKGVTIIDKYTFSGCSSLASITIPEGLTTIGSQAFYGCKSLSTIALPQSLTTIDDNAFNECFGLTSITIPKNVTSIGSVIFEMCYGIQSIVVEEGNTVYDSRDNCNALIETATNTLLAGCQNTVIPQGISTIAIAAFYRCYPLTTITIPEGVTAMYDGAFQETGLTYASIPATMRYIDDCVSQGYTSLATVCCYAETITETGETVFAEVPLADATLYVPATSLDLYKATAPWSQFGAILPIGVPEGIAHHPVNAEVSPRQPIYDLSGRLIVNRQSLNLQSLKPGSSKGSQGVYIHEGKKYIIK